VNISSLDGESLTGGELDCTTYSEETSNMEALMDGAYGNGGGGGGGGIRVHPLWMDAMEEVVWMGGMRVHPLRMHGIRSMFGVGDNKHPHTVQVME
jgi:hypothetical protein